MLTSFALVSPREGLLWGIGAALTFGVPFGVGGFVFGVGARWVRRWIGERGVTEE